MNTFQKRLLEEFSDIRDLLETNTDVSYNAFAAVFQGLIDSAKRSFDAQAAKAAEVAAIPEAFKTLETENTKLKELLDAVQTRLQHITSTRAQQPKRHGPGPQPDFDEQLLYSHLAITETGHVRLEADQKSLEADKKSLEAAQIRLDAAQTRLDAAQTRLDAGEIRLEAILNLLKADQKQLNSSIVSANFSENAAKVSETLKTEVIAQINDLYTKQAKTLETVISPLRDLRALSKTVAGLAEGVSGQVLPRMESGLKRVESELDEKLSRIDDFNFKKSQELSGKLNALHDILREFAKISEEKWLKLASRRDIRGILQSHLSELPNKIDVRSILQEYRLATKGEVAALLQTEQSKLPNKEDIKELFRQQAEKTSKTAEKNYKAAQAADGAALASLKELAEVAALLRAEQSKLPNQEDIEALFRQQAEKNSKAAQAAHNAALVSFKELAANIPAPAPEASQEPPHLFWESPDRNLGKLLWNIPVIEADLSNDQVMHLSTQLITDNGARFTMQNFLAQPSKSWYCIEALLDRGLGGIEGQTHEAFNYHASKICIIGKVAEYKYKNVPRNGLILRHVEYRRQMYQDE